MVTIGGGRTRLTAKRASLFLAVGLVLIVIVGCWRSDSPVERQPVTLKIGFGLSAGTNPERGIQQAARTIALDQLVGLPADGRAAPRIFENWSTSNDRLKWVFHLRPRVTFHDGRRADAETIRGVLKNGLPQRMGPAFADIDEIRAVSDNTIEVSLKQPSVFLLEALDVQIQQPNPAQPGQVNGTGPFSMVGRSGDQAEMHVNEKYFGGQPSIDRVLIKPYTSVRSAWADLLRGQVDMLYDVGVDSLDSLEASSEVRVFTFQRGFAYMLLLNVNKPYLADPAVRRGLNAAIDRDELVKTVLRGHGTPAVGAVWPQHWAYSSDLPRLEYAPRSLAAQLGQRRLKCVMFEPSHERIALAVQRQLQAVGVNLDIEVVTDDKVVAQRLATGDFDAFLSDFPQGPPLVRPFLFWYSKAPFNYGRFSSAEVDNALDMIRHAADDAAYKNGVALFQRAIVADPPAIFLAWRERARAVSTRFDVPVERDTDILTALHLWRPAADERLAKRN